METQNLVLNLETRNGTASHLGWCVRPFSSGQWSPVGLPDQVFKTRKLPDGLIYLITHIFISQMDDGTYQFFQGRNVLPLSSAKPSLQTTFAGVQRSPNLKSTVNLKRKIESSHHASGIQKSSATGSSHPKEWSLGEEKKVREPRSMGWGWTAISGQLPGRSSIACRLHFQNVLEPKLRWNEEEKTKFARLYDRYVLK